MWAKLIVSGTLLPVLVHSILGCCWHHAHSSEQVDFEAVAAAVESQIHPNGDSHDHCCHHEKSDSQVPCEDHKSCDDVNCVYLTVEAGRSESLLDLREVVAAWNSVDVPLLNATGRALRILRADHGVPPSLQHRALTQVWVV